MPLIWSLQGFSIPRLWTEESHGLIDPNPKSCKRIAVKEKAAAVAKAQEAAKKAEEQQPKEAKAGESTENEKAEPSTEAKSAATPDSKGNEAKPKEPAVKERLILHTIDKTEHEKQVQCFTEIINLVFSGAL